MATTRPRGWWYPWIFVAGMLLVVLVNGALVFFAVESWTGLETKDAYRKGLAYNQTLAAARSQAERGWTMVLSFAPQTATDNGHHGTLSVTFLDRGGRPLEDLTVEAKLVRPTQEGFDADLSLAHQGGGVYAGTVNVPLPGQWDARIHARRHDEGFQAHRRLLLP